MSETQEKSFMDWFLETTDKDCGKDLLGGCMLLHYLKFDPDEILQIVSENLDDLVAEYTSQTGNTVSIRAEDIVFALKEYYARELAEITE
jgi:hypothetical protein